MWKDKIIKERKNGLSFKQISKKLGCSLGTVSYHLGKGQKEKSISRAKQYDKNQHPYYKKWKRFRQPKSIKNKDIQKYPIRQRNKLYMKLKSFQRRGKNMCTSNSTYTIEDIINKIGENPICYLTGQPIDINKTRTYHFDHIVPVSRGGSNELDNLQICSKIANQAKSNMTLDEFLQLCENVLVHNGYQIKKPR